MGVLDINDNKLLIKNRFYSVLVLTTFLRVNIQTLRSVM